MYNLNGQLTAFLDTKTYICYLILFFFQYTCTHKYRCVLQDAILNFLLLLYLNNELRSIILLSKLNQNHLFGFCISSQYA